MSTLIRHRRRLQVQRWVLPLVGRSQRPRAFRSAGNALNGDTPKLRVRSYSTQNLRKARGRARTRHSRSTLHHLVLSLPSLMVLRARGRAMARRTRVTRARARTSWPTMLLLSLRGHVADSQNKLLRRWESLSCPSACVSCSVASLG
jgi:hypothetical protein